MKNIIIQTLLTSLLFIASAALQSQSNSAKEYDLPIDEEFKFTYFQKEGILVFTDKSDQLIIFDILEKKIVSKDTIPSIHKYGTIHTPLEKYPFFWVRNLFSTKEVNNKTLKGLASLKSKFKQKSVNSNILINYITGKIVLDTKDYITNSGVKYDNSSIKDLSFYPDPIAIQYDGLKTFSIGEIEKKTVFMYKNIIDKNLSWQIDEPNNVKKRKFISPIWLKPLFDKTSVILGYGRNLYGFSSVNGDILWKHEDVSSTYKNISQQNEFHRTTDSLLYIRKGPKKIFSKEIPQLFAINTKNGKMAWEKPIKIDLNTVYEFTEKGILISNGKNTNVYNFNLGLPIWKNNLLSGNNIKSIFTFGNKLVFKFYTPQEDQNFLRLSTSKEDQLFFNILKDSTFFFRNHALVKGKKFNRIISMSKKHIYLTDQEIGILDNNGKKLVSNDKILPSSNNWYTDKKNKECYYISGKKVFKLDINENKITAIIKLPKIRGRKEDFIEKLRVTDSCIVINSQRNLLIFDKKGNLKQNIYYRHLGMSAGLKKTLINVGTLAAGLLLKNEVAEIYDEALKQGLISNSDFGLDASAVMLYGRSAGYATIANKYTDRLIKFEDEIKNSNSFNKFWIIEDKKDSKEFGLRVTDITTGKQTNFITISKKRNYDYEIVPKLGELFYIKGTKLIFEKLN